MPVALEFDSLPASTLEVLTSMLTADPGAGTARRWADDVLTAGISSDALVELALLGDHEWNRVTVLLPQALRDAGIEAEPRGRLLLLFYRLLLRAYLEGRAKLGDLSILLETFLAQRRGTEGIAEDQRQALWDFLNTLMFYEACGPGSGQSPVSVEQDDVIAAAWSAFTRLNA